MNITTWDNSVYKSEQGPHSCRNIQIFSRKKTHPLGTVQRQGWLVGCWRLDTGSLARLKQLPVAMYTWAFFWGGGSFISLHFFQVGKFTTSGVATCRWNVLSCVTPQSPGLGNFSSSWRVGEQQHNTYARCGVNPDLGLGDTFRDKQRKSHLPQRYLEASKWVQMEKRFSKGSM